MQTKLSLPFRGNPTKFDPFKDIILLSQKFSTNIGLYLWLYRLTSRHFKLHPTSFYSCWQISFWWMRARVVDLAFSLGLSSCIWSPRCKCVCVCVCVRACVCVRVFTAGCFWSMVAWYLWEYRRSTGLSIPLTLLAHGPVCFRQLSRSLVPPVLGHAGQRAGY